MCDQMKAKASDLYWEGGCATPSLRSLAETGVLFENAYTPHPLCVPARVSLWTSQYPHTTGARRNETHMPPHRSHAFDIWKKSGYHTGLIGKNHCFTRDSDLEMFDTFCEISHRGLVGDGKTRGMDWVRPIDAINAAHAMRRDMPWQTPQLSCAVTDFPLEDYSTGLIAAQTEAFIENHREDPFCLWVSFPDPHEPFEAPRRYYDALPEDEIVLPPWDAGSLSAAPRRNRILHSMLGVPEDDIALLKRTVAVHYAMIRFIDDGVGRIIAALERTGLRENTIIVFCSDHGDFAGEHRMTVKGGVFYDCLTRVPLILSYPAVISPTQPNPSLVSLLDIVPTILALQGIDTPDGMQGRELPYAPGMEVRDSVVSEYGAGGHPFREEDLTLAPKPYGYKTVIQSLRWREAEGRRKMIRSGSWKYVHDPMGDLDELYHLEHDPWELRNLAADPDHAQTVGMMKEKLLAWSIETEDSSPVPLPEPKLRL